MKRLLLVALLSTACVTTAQEGEQMRQDIAAIKADLKKEMEATAGDRQKDQQRAKALQDALDQLSRAARKSGADLAVDVEKNQNETGITLSFFRSEAIHCTRKRPEKNACPRNPTVNQKCSEVIIDMAALSTLARPSVLEFNCSRYRTSPGGRKEFRRPCEASIRRWWTKSGARPRRIRRGGSPRKRATSWASSRTWPPSRTR